MRSPGITTMLHDLSAARVVSAAGVAAEPLGMNYETRKRREKAGTGRKGRTFSRVS